MSDYLWLRIRFDSHDTSYSRKALVQKMYGEKASVLLSCAISLYIFGALVVFNIIIGDVLTALAHRHLGPNRYG